MSLVVENISKIYKKTFSMTPPFKAVSNVSFQIEPGEIFALLGPNGAGKSSIIKMIAGLVIPTSGQILLDGEPLGDGSSAYKKLSAVLEGTRNIYWRLTPLENLHYFANLRGRRSSDITGHVNELLRLFEIEGKKENQSQHLSRGMLQKLAFATALVTDPTIILLDEPTLGLDVPSSRKIKELIKELAFKYKKTILLTTHQMDLVEEVADRVGILQQGVLIREGRISELRSLFENYLYTVRIRGYFEIPADITATYNTRTIHLSQEFTEFEADCKNRAGFFQLLETINSAEEEVIFARKSTDNLEEIFLRVLS